MRFEIFSGIFLFLVSSSAWAQILVVGGKDFPEEQLMVSQVKDAYLGRSLKLKNGKTLVPLDRMETTEKIRSRFYNSLLGWTISKTKAHWSQIVFTGRGEAPSQVADLSALKRRVSSEPGTIGFIDKHEDQTGFKILASLPES